MPRPKTRDRLAPVKIPIALNAEFVKLRELCGDTHTQAIEAAIRLYVESKRQGPA